MKPNKPVDPKLSRMSLLFIDSMVGAIARLLLISWFLGIFVGIFFMLWMTTKEVLPAIAFFATVFLVSPYIVYHEGNRSIDRVFYNLQSESKRTRDKENNGS